MPDAVDLPAGHRLLFGVTDPSTQRRSGTWMVRGKTRTRDLYVGTREMMTTVKASIHASGMVRIARTEQFAALAGLQGDRLMDRFHPPVAGDGWWLALQIAVPDASLMDRPALAGPEAGASWWPTPGPRAALVFPVFTTNSDAADKAGQVFAAVGHVGGMLLPGGGSVWVIVDAIRTDDDFEEGSAAHRRNAQLAHETAGPLRPGIEPMQAWGQIDGVPLLIDMGGFISTRTEPSQKQDDCWPPHVPVIARRCG